MQYCLPWACYVGHHRLMTYPYNAYVSRRARSPKSIQISWVLDILSASLELASRRGTIVNGSESSQLEEIISHTVSSARVSSHTSTSFTNSWSWSSGASAATANLCNKSFSLFSSTVSGRSTWSFLALAGSNFLRQRGQIRGLKANRHLRVIWDLLHLEWISRYTHGRQNMWPHGIACGVWAIVCHVYASKHTSQRLEGCRISMHTARRLKRWLVWTSDSRRCREGKKHEYLAKSACRSRAVHGWSNQISQHTSHTTPNKKTVKVLLSME
jgi:hypothetical protein